MLATCACLRPYLVVPASTLGSSASSLLQHGATLRCLPITDPVDIQEYRSCHLGNLASRQTSSRIAHTALQHTPQWQTPACMPCVARPSFSMLVVFMLAVNGGVDKYGSLPVMMAGTSGGPPAADRFHAKGLACLSAQQTADWQHRHWSAGSTPLLCSVHMTCSVPLTSARSLKTQLRFLKSLVSEHCRQSVPQESTKAHCVALLLGPLLLVLAVCAAQPTGVWHIAQLHRVCASASLLLVQRERTRTCCACALAQTQQQLCSSCGSPCLTCQVVSGRLGWWSAPAGLLSPAR